MKMNSIFTEGTPDARSKRYIAPKRLVWQSGPVDSPEKIIESEKPIQATLNPMNNFCTMKEGGSILVDFGCELHGGLALVIQGGSCEVEKAGSLHIRFGESVMECMTPVFTEKNPTNDHAIRDFDLMVPTMGTIEVGYTGFRFVRIDCLKGYAQLSVIRATFTYQDVEYKGSFESDDEMLNKIWETAVYTVHLNMQNFLWDGIKRDRLVWIGDMHPETSTIQKVFGYNECVPKSLDFTRECFEPNKWINNIPSYSMWWIKIHWDWYMQNGDYEYLYEQKDYLYKMLEFIFTKIKDDGTIDIDRTFIDWPTEPDPKGSRAGMHAILTMAMDAAANIAGEYKDEAMRERCLGYAKILKAHVPEPGDCKQAAALLALAGCLDYDKVNKEVLSVDPLHKLSTFLGYYILKARGEAGDVTGTIELMDKFWGKMIELGATTFFEDFNLEWADNAYRIDELVPEGANDIHGDHGAFCYKGFRHSLCHGWASGPAAYIQEYILGVKVLEPGCKKVRVAPDLGSLNHVKGTYPTPYGNISIEATKNANGETEVKVSAPPAVTVVR